MNIKIALAVLIALPSLSFASPFVVSDATTQKVTHCGVMLDSGAKVDVPVVSDSPTTAICKYDIGGVSVGPHTIKTTFINIDPIWGRSESVYSTPLDFVRPGDTVSQPPAGLNIVK